MTTQVDRYTGLKEVLGEDLFNKVHNCRVLVVGAGGIGCELLKNLVLSGFRNIDIIDLDTIDVSNLNRQFLFEKRHVGHSKAQVARESALLLNPDANITAHHADIKSSQYGLSYVSQFAMVMNALDNLSARRHVNRLCFTAGVPLIESGTQGYLGQVQFIFNPKNCPEPGQNSKVRTECFECQPKAPPKTYPVCTIRSNPSTPIHCIVWAKMLFGRFFGKADDTNAVTDLDDQAAGQDSNAAPVEPEVKAALDADKLQLESEKKISHGRAMFHKVYHSDTLQLSTMKDLWKGKKPPTPLSFESASAVDSNNSNANNAEYIIEDQRVWSVRECAEKFVEVVNQLNEERVRTGTDLEWDKDVDLHLDFVTAATNLRAHIFNIPLQSRFTVKADAGNIIPAIATTNAIIAGLIVMEAFKVLEGDYSKCLNTYLYRFPTRKRLLYKMQPEEPNPKCYVCGAQSVFVSFNTRTTTFRTFVEEVVKQRLNFKEPSIMVGDDIMLESGADIDEEDKERYEKQLDKFCDQVRISHNAIVEVEDFVIENFKLQISIAHVEGFDDPEKKFEIAGEAPSVPTVPAASNTNTTEKKDDEDDVVFVTAVSADEAKQAEAVNGTNNNNKKRKRGEENDEDEPARKKVKANNNNNNKDNTADNASNGHDEVIMLD
jgi:ubiquitin-like 1-activating enzyme E1 B